MYILADVSIDELGCICMVMLGARTTLFLSDSWPVAVGTWLSSSGSLQYSLLI